MSQRKTDMRMISHSLKFSTMKQAIKEADRIIRITKEESHKINGGCDYKILVGVSRNEAFLGEFKPKTKRTKGRPKKEYEPYQCMKKFNNIKALTETPIHVHTVLLANPARGLAVCICQRLNKGKDKPIATTHKCNSGYIEYITAQAEHYRQDEYGDIKSWDFGE